MYDPNEATSATLLARLHDTDDAEAWIQFVKRYEPVMRSFCRRKGLSEALSDDIVSRVNLVLVRHMPTFEYDVSKSFRAWLKTVLRSQVVNLFREESRRVEHAQGGTLANQHLQQVAEDWAPETLADDLTDELSGVIDRDRMCLAQIIDTVKKRAPKSWQAFELRKLQGLDGATVAKQLDMTVAAVHVAVSRTMRLLETEAALLNTDPDSTE